MGVLFKKNVWCFGVKNGVVVIGDRILFIVK